MEKGHEAMHVCEWPYCCNPDGADAAEVRAQQAELENERLAREHTQVHKWNNQLVKEHYDLRAEITRLRAVVETARAFAEEIQEDHPAIDPVRLQALNDALDALAAPEAGA